MAATNEAYGNPAWGSGPAGSPSWGPPPWGDQGWHDRPHWARDIPKPVWIAFMVLGFVFWWPVGLAMLLYLLGTGRLGCGRGRYWPPQQQGYAAGPTAGAPWGGWCWPRWGADTAPPSSGNRAFDEYRTETLRRLEEEQREFAAFLERLRAAKDRSEFEQFMAERRARPPQPGGTGEPQQ
jgi:hypothetical protein